MQNKISLRMVLYLSVLVIVLAGGVLSWTSLDLVRDARVRRVLMEYNSEGIVEGRIMGRMQGNNTNSSFRQFSFSFDMNDGAKKRIVRMPKTNVSNVFELCVVMTNARMVRYLDTVNGKYESYLCDRGFGTNFEIVSGEPYEVYFKGDSNFNITIKS